MKAQPEYVLCGAVSRFGGKKIKNYIWHLYGIDGEDGSMTSLYRCESRRPQQGSLGHIIQ